MSHLTTSDVVKTATPSEFLPSTNLYVTDRVSSQREVERVYGQRALTLLYGGTLRGRLIKYLAARFSLVSSLYGWFQKLPSSKSKIVPFIKLFNIDSTEFVKKPKEFSSFNDFFVRELKASARPIDDNPLGVVCPADGRYRFYPCIHKSEGFIIKGEKFDLGTLLQDNELAERYKNGSMMIARLCPSDYHRFHFPAAGRASQTELINGWLYSVNPLALQQDIHIFTKNKRALTEIKTEKFGEILYLEIGATNVGSIIQTFEAENRVEKGQEKGYFEFGASALVLLFEAGKIEFSQDLLELYEKGLEIKCLMGQPLGNVPDKTRINHANI